MNTIYKTVPLETFPQWQAKNRRIVSVDGEGKRVEGRHAYTLLAAADDKGYRDHIEHDGTIRPTSVSDNRKMGPYEPTDVAANHGLSTIRCLDFLLGIPEHESDLVISFSFVYDITKIMQDVPWKNLCEFAEHGITVWHGYVLEWIPRKYFVVSKNGKRCKVWDTFSYWQMSFAKALASSLELFDMVQREVINFITAMKLERGHLEDLSEDDVLRYCWNECEYLSILYRDFLRNCEAMQPKLTPHDHSGPGALANEFFKAVNLKNYMPTGDVYYTCGLPRYVPIHSYYGGRFETAVLGTVGDVYDYDIQSAYPAIAVTLPCLQHGRFIHTDKYIPGKWGFYYVGSKTTGPWAPFPFRVSTETRHLLNNASKGSIAFVHGGRRWVTSPEVEIAINHFGEDAIPVYDGWVFVPGCTHKPFAELESLYLLRKEGNPSEGLSKVIKLIINSVYGKTAQSIGWKRNTSAFATDDPSAYNPPAYQCYIWASLMTGGTRAKVLEAALIGGENVVSIATDGILSTIEIPELTVTDHDLGTWERKKKADCWLGMPGIYSFGASPDDKSFKRRGLDSRYFSASHLRDAWERGQWKVGPCKEPIGFMPLKLAVKRKNGLDVMGEWIPMEKTVKFVSVQHKRNFPESVEPWWNHDGSPIRLEPITIPDNIKSAPYQPKQSWDDIARGRLDDPDMAMLSEDELTEDELIDDWKGEV